MSTARSLRYGLIIFPLICSSLHHAGAEEVVPPARTVMGLHVVAKDFNWKEYFGGLELEESGTLLGVGFHGATRFDDSWQFDYRAEVYAGSVDYDGYIQWDDGSLTPARSETDYAGLNGDIDLSFDLSGSEGPAFRPFGGIGARYWLRSLDNSQGLGYDEYWSTLYLRAGLRVESPAGRNPGWFLAAALIAPVHTDETATDVPGSYGEDIDLSPKEEPGFQLEAGLRSDTWMISVFHERMKFGESDLDASGQYYQPESEMRLSGVRAGVYF